MPDKIAYALNVFVNGGAVQLTTYHTPDEVEVKMIDADPDGVIRLECLNDTINKPIQVRLFGGAVIGWAIGEHVRSQITNVRPSFSGAVQ